MDGDDLNTAMPMEMVHYKGEVIPINGDCGFARVASKTSGMFWVGMPLKSVDISVPNGWRVRNVGSE